MRDEFIEKEKQAIQDRAENNGRSGLLTSSSTTGPEEKSQELYCPFCGTAAESGKFVCPGCQAEVISGLTQFERQEAVKIGMVTGGITAFLVLVVLPIWLESSLGWNIPPLWGLGPYALILVVLIVFIGGFTVIFFSEQKRLHNPPRFFKHNIK